MNTTLAILFTPVIVFAALFLWLVWPIFFGVMIYMGVVEKDYLLLCLGIALEILVGIPFFVGIPLFLLQGWNESK